MYTHILGEGLPKVSRDYSDFILRLLRHILEFGT